MAVRSTLLPVFLPLFTGGARERGFSEVRLSGERSMRLDTQIGGSC